MSSDSERLIGTAIDYSESQLELFDANCRTALSFGGPISEKEIIDMGRRAKARKRAALRAASQSEGFEPAEEDLSTVLSDETNCEIPSIPTKMSPSRIPVLQKGYQFEKSPSAEKSQNVSTAVSPSKIPRPKVNLEYLAQIDVENDSKTYSDVSYEINSEMSTGAPPSFTQKTGDSFTHTTQLTDPHPYTMPLGISPLPICLTTVASSISPNTTEEDPMNQVLVVSETADGTQLQFDAQKVVAAFGLDFAGIRII